MRRPDQHDAFDRLCSAAKRGGAHAGEPQAGRAVVRHCHRAAQFPIEPLRQARHAALGLGAQRARLYPSQHLSGAWLQVA
jgi:hypothetical protein